LPAAVVTESVSRRDAGGPRGAMFFGLVPKPYRQPAGPAALPKHANGNGAYTLRAMSLTCLSNLPKLEATG
jgi:hypothetical protein